MYNTLVQEGNIERFYFEYSILKNKIMLNILTKRDLLEDIAVSFPKPNIFGKLKRQTKENSYTQNNEGCDYLLYYLICYAVLPSLADPASL